ncbi:MAG TPA: hypothetical protein VFJ14_07020 [Nocardioidaceae bacterium]|nr:hypothetical protein [Nocardioidaceae bacterium]
MADLFTIPAPAAGEVFLDARSPDRALRVGWHHESDLVVLSLWRGNTCAGTFRLPAGDVPAFVDTLVCGLRDGYGGSIGSGDSTAHADAC